MSYDAQNHTHVALKILPINEFNESDQKYYQFINEIAIQLKLMIHKCENILSLYTPFCEYTDNHK